MDKNSWENTLIELSGSVLQAKYCAESDGWRDSESMSIEMLLDQLLAEIKYAIKNANSL